MVVKLYHLYTQFSRNVRLSHRRSKSRLFRRIVFEFLSIHSFIYSFIHSFIHSFNVAYPAAAVASLQQHAWPRRVTHLRSSSSKLLESRRIWSIHRARGLPGRRLYLGPEGQPTDKSMCLRIAMCAGTSLSSRAMCPSRSAVAKRPRDALCLSIVSFNSTKRRVESFIVSYVGYRFVTACSEMLTIQDMP